MLYDTKEQILTATQRRKLTIHAANALLKQLNEVKEIKTGVYVFGEQPMQKQEAA